VGDHSHIRWRNVLPTSEQIAQYLPQYTPQTSAGQVSQTLGRVAPSVALGLGAGNAMAMRSLGMSARELDDLVKFALSSNPMAWWPLAAPAVVYAGADAASKVKP
jgi:ABC-type nitrate/sulfonate/bicarbonate transport system permease component